MFFERVEALLKREKKVLNHLKSNKTNMKFAYNILFLMVTIYVGTVANNCSTPVPSIAFFTNPEQICNLRTSAAQSAVSLLQVMDGENNAWLAVKYLTGTGDAAPSEASFGFTGSFDYAASQSVLKDVASASSNIYMLEPASDVSAVMKCDKFSTVQKNIVDEVPWFRNTHGTNDLNGWMGVTSDGKFYPDAKQGGCNNYDIDAPRRIFDSCNNGNGAHTAMDTRSRMRGDHLLTKKEHSIWFKINKLQQNCSAGSYPCCQDVSTICTIPTSGDVQITNDCILYSQIVVTGKLNVTGIPDAQGNLPKIIGGGSNRLFKVESGGELVVKSLNLTGGDVSGNDGTNDNNFGGAVYVAPYPCQAWLS